MILDRKPSKQHIELDCNLNQSLSEVNIPSHDNLPEPMKQDAQLPIISPARETSENDTAPCRANAVTHISAHKLVGNTASNFDEDLTGNDEPSQAEPLCLLTKLAANAP